VVQAGIAEEPGIAVVEIALGISEDAGRRVIGRQLPDRVDAVEEHHTPGRVPHEG
jgi:hypothetical protein